MSNRSINVVTYRPSMAGKNLRLWQKLEIPEYTSSGMLSLWELHDPLGLSPFITFELFHTFVNCRLLMGMQIILVYRHANNCLLEGQPFPQQGGRGELVALLFVNSVQHSFTPYKLWFFNFSFKIVVTFAQFFH